MLALGALWAGLAGLAQAGAYDEFLRALRGDDARSVRALLVRGFDPNAPDAKGHPALLVAIRDGSLAVAEVLLSHPDIQLDSVNGSGETALMMAALQGNVDWVKRLLERGASVNRTGWTPLHYAASGPELSVVALLLERGAALDASAPNGNTPLMMAAAYGAQDAAVLMLEKGADPRVRNRAGNTAIDFALRAGRDRLAARMEKFTR